MRSSSETKQNGHGEDAAISNGSRKRPFEDTKMPPVVNSDTNSNSHHITKTKQSSTTPQSWDEALKSLPRRCFAAPTIRDSSFFYRTQPSATNTISTPHNNNNAATLNSMFFSPHAPPFPQNPYIPHFSAKSYGNPTSSSLSTAAAGSSTQTCLRRLLRELTSLEQDLPSDPPIWLAFDEETPQYCRALITAPDSTPYAYGLFCFDMYVPDRYPSVPPKVQLLTTGGGRVRFSPNLYANGKVCLSLLGTWSGPPWNPGFSSILQVLVSIQGLILGVQHPYYLEPGYGGWENNHTNLGHDDAVTSSATTTTTTTTTTAPLLEPDTEPGNTEAGKDSSAGTAIVSKPTNPPSKPPVSSRIQRYENTIREGTLRYAHIEPMRYYSSNNNNKSAAFLKPFLHIIGVHFFFCKDKLLQEVKSWIEPNQSKKSTTNGTTLHQHHNSPETSGSSGARYLLHQLQNRARQSSNIPQLVTDLEQCVSNLSAPGGLVAADAVTTHQNTTNDWQSLLTHPPKDAASIKALAVAIKEQELKHAVERLEYVAAGRIQAELRELNKVDSSALSSLSSHGCTELTIALTKHDMLQQAAAGNFVKAGQLQLRAQHLERNMHRLQQLQRRIREAADCLDYGKAGSFQQQYRILIQAAGDDESIVHDQKETKIGPLLKATNAPMPSLSYGGTGDLMFDVLASDMLAAEESPKTSSMDGFLDEEDM